MHDLTIIFLIFAYIAFFFVARLQNHKHMLFANLICCFFSSIYLLLNEAYVGAAVSSIAGVASIAQIILSYSGSWVTLKTRNTTAIIFAAVAVTILYQKPSDLLPCMSFIQNRIFEAQVSVKCIRFAVFIGAILWALYAINHQLFLMAFLEITISIYALLCLLNYNYKFEAMATRCLFIRKKASINH